MKHVEIKSETTSAAVHGHLPAAAHVVKKPTPAAAPTQPSGLLTVNRPVVLLGAKAGEATTPATTSSTQLNTRTSKVQFDANVLGSVGYRADGIGLFVECRLLV